MNIKKHFYIGILGSIIMKSEWFLYGSLVIDLPLVFNEYKIQKNKCNFDPNEVSVIETILYRITHSLFFIPMMFYTGGWIFCIGGGVHQIMDWGTHTGKFNTRILSITTISSL